MQAQLGTDPVTRDRLLRSESADEVVPNIQTSEKKREGS